jgi:hypothetical protein
MTGLFQEVGSAEGFVSFTDGFLSAGFGCGLVGKEWVKLVMVWHRFSVLSCSDCPLRLLQEECLYVGVELSLGLCSGRVPARPCNIMGWSGPFPDALELFSNSVELSVECSIFGAAFFGVAFVDGGDCCIALLDGYGSALGQNSAHCISPL